jgi:hypothetical protein
MEDKMEYKTMEDNPIQDRVNKDVNEDSSSKDRGSAPTRPKGPNAAPVVLGLVALAFAALIIAAETMDLKVDWSRLGPGGIVGVGALLVVLGAIGLVRRHDDG